MTNLASNLVRTAEQHPDVVAIKLDAAELTWSQLHQLAAKAAGAKGLLWVKRGPDGLTGTALSKHLSEGHVSAMGLTDGALALVAAGPLKETSAALAAARAGFLARRRRHARRRPRARRRAAVARRAALLASAADRAARRARRLPAAAGAVLGSHQRPVRLLGADVVPRIRGVRGVGARQAARASRTEQTARGRRWRTCGRRPGTSSSSTTRWAGRPMTTTSPRCWTRPQPSSASCACGRWRCRRRPSCGSGTAPTGRGGDGGDLAAA